MVFGQFLVVKLSGTLLQHLSEPDGYGNKNVIYIASFIAL